MSFQFKQEIEIAGRPVGPGHPVYVVAEAGVAHFGSLEKALTLVDLAAEAGADAVKFQIFRAEYLISGQDRQWQKRMASRELPYEAFQHIAAYSRQKGIAFFATAHDGPSLEFLESLNPPAYKIGSGEVYNWDFIARAAAKGKPLIVSTGMYDWAAVDELARCLQGAGNPEVVVLHCVTQYPTPPAEVNLRAMDALRQRLGCLVGYSDHTKGFHICLAAVARGACLLEKHISLDFNLPDAQDWKVSCGPHDLAEMISQMREVEQSLGVEEKFASPGEQASLQWARKSLVAARELPAGTVLEEAMLVARRPGTGIPPSRSAELLGRRTRRAVAADQLLAWEDLE